MTPATTATPPRRDSRRATRQLPRGSTGARVYRNTLGLGPDIAVAVLDVSEAGIRLLLTEDLPLARRFEVNLQCPGTLAVKVIAQVVWSVPAADGNFVVGACFQATISLADLHALAGI